MREGPVRVRVRAGAAEGIAETLSGRVLTTTLAVVAVGSVAVVAVDRLFRPQTGPFALAAVVEAHVVLVGGLAGVAAIVLALGERSRGARWVRLAGVAAVVVAVIVLGGEWWSPPASAAALVPARAGTLRVLSWNLEVGSRASDASVAGIAARPADLVALQELTPPVARAIEADPDLVAAYPYRILRPRDDVFGLGLLSRLPLTTSATGTIGPASADVLLSADLEPLALRAGLLLPGGRRLEVFDVHPLPPAIQRAAGIPVGLDSRRRDADLARIHEAVAAIEDPASALVVGDFNAGPAEPGFAAVATGLRDAHAEAGVGTGFTWRPSSLEGLGLGFLRIDHVLAGDALRPVAADEDCSIAGDHCRLYATLERVTPPS